MRATARAQGLEGRLVMDLRLEGISHAVIEASADQLEFDLLAVLNPLEELAPDASDAAAIRLRVLVYAREIGRLMELAKILN